MALSDLIYVDGAGIHYPDFPTLLEQLRAEYRAIFGQDINLDEDTQDGQWLGVCALALFDAAQVAVAVYNSFSPATAQGDALSRNVAINGIARLVASHSTVDVRIVGQAGTVITRGQCEDTQGNKWDLPESVAIPLSGEITVTATAVEIGDITAAAGSVSKIATPTRGWQTVENPLPATPGRAIETDAELRARQKESTMLGNRTALGGIIGAVLAVDGVIRAKGYENDAGVTNADGIPAHTVAIVADGGDAQTISETIAAHKAPGVGTFGDNIHEVTDEYGAVNTIKFYRSTPITVTVQCTIKARQGYISTTAEKMKQAIVDYIGGLKIGDDVYVTKVYVPADLQNEPLGDTFDITALTISRGTGEIAIGALQMAFNERAVCALENVTVTAT